MAQTRRIILRARNETAHAAPILPFSSLVSVDFEVERVGIGIRADCVRCRIALDKVIPFVAILNAERNVQITGDLFTNHSIFIKDFYTMSGQFQFSSHLITDSPTTDHKF